MAFDRFLISPINSGLQTDLRPWQILDDSFEYLQNLYSFRGRVRKRFGSLWTGASQLNSRLTVSLGTNANMPINIPHSATVTQLAIGQMFSLGMDTFSIYQLGAGVSTLSTNPAVSAVIDSTVNPNTVTFTGGALTTVYWYPSLPVMGIDQYEMGAVNNHPTYIFDTKYVYTWTGTQWLRSGDATHGDAFWHGSDINFFWTCTWQGLSNSGGANTFGNPVFFASNFYVANPNGATTANDDPIWYTYNGTNWVAIAGNGNANGFYFLPGGGAPYAGPWVQTARIVVPFKNRLVLLNTIEVTGATNTNYVNRCRYSWNGSPFAVNAWYEPNQSDNAGNVAAGAGYIDAATEEQIISAEFVKDRLIVYFERSTWELAYTGNEILPFVWQKLNTELGSQSTFSTVPFDKAILTIGNTGVHACNGSNVERIDQKIPDEIFEFKVENNDFVRTAGIRDYVTELVYWSFVSDEATQYQTYPNQILVYNYRTANWAKNDDCFTAFGYFEQQTDMTWASSVPLTWATFNGTWISNIEQANQRQILAGTPEGFIVRLAVDVSRNAPTMAITNMTFSATGIATLTIINHNLSDSEGAFGFGDYILLENIIGNAGTQAVLNGVIVPVTVVDANTITIDTNPLAGGPLTNATGSYLGSGTAARVSNTQALTKQFNPYVQQNRNVTIGRVDFGVQRTANGQITVDYYPSSTLVSLIEGGQASGAILGNSILETSPYSAVYYPLEQYQTLLWHPIYFQGFGEFIQFGLYLSEQQITNPNIAFSDFELQGMILHTQRAGERLQ